MSPRPKPPTRSLLVPKDLELRLVFPIEDGISRMRAAINSQGAVLCPCSAGRDYHIGARDALEMLLQAAVEGLLRRHHGERNEERYFVPVNPSGRLARRLAAEGAEATAAVDRAYGILCEAFPSFRIHARLADQDAEVRANFLELFRRLQDFGYLPPTTRHPEFNFQGMTLLMEQCFSSRDMLIECLHDPGRLSSTVTERDLGASTRGGAIDHLTVFLCYASDDKEAVRSLYRRLGSDRIRAWFDEEDLLPGQDWDLEIRKAVAKSDAVIVCLSRRSVAKTGYVQREIEIALDAADKQPEGTIFIIPAKLEPTDVPIRLQKWQWVSLTGEGGYKRLLSALRARAAEVPSAS